MVMKWSCHKTTPSGQEKTSFFKDLVSQRYKHAMDLKNNSKKIKNKKPPTTIPFYPITILLLNLISILVCRNSTSILKVAWESMAWVSKSWFNPQLAGPILSTSTFYCISYCGPSAQAHILKDPVFWRSWTLRDFTVQ